jgi:hypothetical protein
MIKEIQSNLKACIKTRTCSSRVSLLMFSKVKFLCASGGTARVGVVVEIFWRNVLKPNEPRGTAAKNGNIFEQQILVYY